MKWNPARILVVLIVLLLWIGIVMLASTSVVKGSASKDDSSYFIKRQLVWLMVALAVGVAASNVKVDFWRQHAFFLLGFAVLLLVSVLLFGRTINGSKRWLVLAGVLRFQPSEFAKFAIVTALANWMSHVGSMSSRFREGLLIPGAAIGLVAALIIAEPDFGTCMLVGAVGMLVMFMGGTRLRYLVVTGVAAFLSIALLILHNPVRANRIWAFLNREENPEGAYQLVQSINSLVLGGTTGVGYGNSLQKYHYLPEAHTDFILAIIGEELGAMTIGIVILYAGILMCGTKISMGCRDPFGRLLGMGITAMITMQAAINVGVVTGCLPTKGLPLPLISYGGTSLVMTMLSLGVLLSIARFSGDTRKPATVPIVKNRAHSV
ncbi:MAG: putative lipid II flippase FtsW [Verrucomicrobia bacterium]|nr:putative lipid II flippase FtsW [Verrucomicrobiota bacterium]MDA1085828.1 putative lipid II flippase FtsW [Verrucomicrobiota bacterium]